MVTESTTMLTDYGLGVLCALFGWRLWVTGQAPMRTSVKYWAGGMGSLAAAAAAGGTVHGWALTLTEPVLSALWKGAGLAVGVANFCFFCGTLAASVASPIRRWVMAVPCLQFVGYIVWMSGHNDFRYVIYNYGVTFAIILFIQVHGGLVRKAPPAGWIIAGVLVSFLAALVQQSGMDPHSSFDHNDLYHVVQMAGVALLYRGAGLLRDC